MEEKKLCECGCGQTVNPRRRFINGHQRIGMKCSDESIKKMIKSRKEYWETHPNARDKASLKTKEQYSTQEARDEQSKRLIEFNKNNPEARKENARDRMKSKLEPELCKCGCGNYANSGCEFINGHQNRTDKYWEPELEQQLCKCGCGGYAEPGYDFIRYHYWNDPINHEKLSATKQDITYDEWEEFACKQLYCPDFNNKCRESNREKYNRCCFLTGIPESENITSTNKQQRLSVHHVDMDKGQGCNDIRWKLVPLSLKCHGRVHNELWESRIIWLLSNVWNK